MGALKFPHSGRVRLLAAASVGLVLALAAPTASAELGGNCESVLHDQAEMHATLTTEEHPAYTTYILDMPDGTQVREYFSLRSGVFAIGWTNGHPNMRLVLGVYYDRLVQAMEARYAPGAPHHGRNNPIRYDDPDFVYFAQVAISRFTGRAYLPQAVPQGVDIADVR